MILKVYNLMLGADETRYLVHESCQCKCGLNESVCNSKQKWDHDECRCECNELDDWGSFKDDYIWCLSMCNCECNKARESNEYLDIENCFCKKRLSGILVLACENEISIKYNWNLTWC